MFFLKNKRKEKWSAIALHAKASEFPCFQFFMKKFLNITNENKKYIDAQYLLQDICMGMDDSLVFKNKAYIAGGSVRDEILGQVSTDIDIVVECENGGILLAEYICKILSLHSPVTFPRFGTAQVQLKNCVLNSREYFVDGAKIEFVCTRKEKYDNDSRKPEVSYGTLLQDVERRDFTINSLLKKVTSGPILEFDDIEKKIKNGDILDLTGRGINDIKNKIIITPLNPDIIFKEDPLRILRAIRFHSKYNWEIAKETLDGIKNNVYRLDVISKERIRDEIDKIIGYNKLYEALIVMKETGVLEKIFPELHNLIGITQSKKYHSEGDAFTHTLLVIKNMQKLIDKSSVELLWSAMSHDFGKAITKTEDENGIHFYGHEKISSELVEFRMRKLKYPLNIIKNVVFIVSSHMRPTAFENWSDRAYRKFYRDMGSYFDDVLLLAKADELSSIREDGLYSNIYDSIKNKIEIAYVVKIPDKLFLNGNDMIELTRNYIKDFQAGPIVGKLMSLQVSILLEDPSIMSGNIKQKLISAIISDNRFFQIIGIQNENNI